MLCMVANLARNNPSADCTGSDEETWKTALLSKMFRAAEEFCSISDVKLGRCGKVYIYERR